MKKQIIFLLAFCMSVTAQAALQITRSGGWLESAFVEWTADAGEDNFKVVVVPASGGSMWEIDRALIRSYGSYYRADALGLSAGEYELLVFPVYPVQEGVEAEPEPVFSGRLAVRAHDRNGFAHFNYPDGVGAYRNDGQLKDGATVLYVHAGNAKTIEMDVTVDKKGGQRHCVGLQHILTAYEKGFANVPLDIRILGTIEANQLDSFGSKEEGLQIKGKVGVPMHITLEGVGDDAVIRGFGVLARQAESLELRNFAIMSALDDCISLDTKNNHVWVHHLDGFYSQPGSAADQKKGDGTIDVKTDSKYVTVSYNHFWDSGKSAMCGMKSETGPNYITYHHNWFDHSDSRHPRIRTMSVHVYNNYFDGNAKYCVGVTTGSSAFVENNYFRNCPRPMLSSMQGTDTRNGTDEKDAPTFSKEDGGIIKAYNNIFSGTKTLVYYSATNPVQFDAYLASSRSEQVPAEVTTKQGGTGYNNFDTDASLMPVITPDAPDSVPAIVRSEFGAGRMCHSDIDFSLANADDSSSDINQQLVSLIAGYESSLVAILGEDYVKPQAIDCPSVDTDLRFDGRALLNPQGKVLRIYTLSGACLGTTTDTYISTDALPTGHYIAVSPDGAIKW